MLHCEERPVWRCHGCTQKHKGDELQVCGICKEEKARKNFHKKEDSGNVTDLCTECAFPHCSRCDYQYPRNKGAVAKDAPARVGRDWYCERTAECKAALQAVQRSAAELRVCDTCHTPKRSSAFSDYEKDRKLTCASCEHPVCEHCGYQHPRTQRAVQRNARSRVGLQWFCGRKKSCDTALAKAKTKHGSASSSSQSKSQASRDTE